MSFMQKQVTIEQRWLEVETSCGTEWIPEDLIGPIETNQAENEPLDAKTIKQYCEGEVYSWTNRKGYGARLSAPGYMDCTEWSVFDTAEKAEQYLTETYPDDEEDGEDNETN